MTSSRYIGDNFTRSGAERLAYTIENYWARHGRKVQTWVVAFEHGQLGKGWVVRSNMRNIFPARD